MPEPSLLFALLLLLTTAACGFMNGLVVFVDIVHYPSFHYADKKRGQEFHRFHTKYTGYVVGVPMLLEMASGVLLPFAAIWAELPFIIQVGSWISFILLTGVWAETGFRVIPKHNALQRNGLHNEEQIRALVRSNRYRTLMWGIRFLLLLFILCFLLFSAMD